MTWNSRRADTKDELKASWSKLEDPAPGERESTEHRATQENTVTGKDL